MKSQTTRRLRSLASEIAGARAELGMLRERLADQARALEDSRLRMLIAETPVADGEHRTASEHHRRIEERLRRAEVALGGLLAEERRLSRDDGGR